MSESSLREARVFFDHLNQRYLGVHKAKEELFWTTYMAISDDHGGFARAEQAYKACQGVLGFERKVGRERLINACRRAIEYENYSYGAIKTILENKYDMITYAEITADIPEHENIRGEKYYQ